MKISEWFRQLTRREDEQEIPDLDYAAQAKAALQAKAKEAVERDKFLMNFSAGVMLQQASSFNSATLMSSSSGVSVAGSAAPYQAIPGTSGYGLGSSGYGLGSSTIITNSANWPQPVSGPPPRDDTSPHQVILNSETCAMIVELIYRDPAWQGVVEMLTAQGLGPWPYFDEVIRYVFQRYQELADRLDRLHEDSVPL